MAWPEERYTHSPPLYQQFLFTNFCLFVYIVPGRSCGRQLLLCLHCPQRTHSRSLSLSLSVYLTTPPPFPHSPCLGHKVQRVAPKVANIFFSLFCCLVPPPLNRQIPDAIMRRLVKLSHSRTAQRSKAPSTGLGVQNTHRSCDKHPKYFVVFAVC